MNGKEGDRKATRKKKSFHVFSLLARRRTLKWLYLFKSEVWFFFILTIFKQKKHFLKLIKLHRLRVEWIFWRKSDNLHDWSFLWDNIALYVSSFTPSARADKLISSSTISKQFFILSCTKFAWCLKCLNTFLFLFRLQFSTGWSLPWANSLLGESSGKSSHRTERIWWQIRYWNGSFWHVRQIDKFQLLFNWRLNCLTC